MRLIRSLCSTVLIFLAAGLLCPSIARAQAKAWIVTDAVTGFVLDSSNPAKKLPIGSLTKIATAMVVLDWADAEHRDLNEIATVPNSVAGVSAAQGVGFTPGDQVTLRDLLYAAMMQSDNQAAETLAIHVGTTLGGGNPEEKFVAQMNALARRLGMTQTRFLNPHGLDGLERSDPYSTAADLAKLTTYAMDNSAFRFYVSQKERKISIQTATGEQNQYLLRNTNELLGLNSIDGVKTGTTRKAGQCIIISAARPPESRQEGEQHFITPRRLNVVVLGAADRFGLATNLLQRGWQRYDEWAAAGRPQKGWKPSR
jgi:D-alanyl-D-alanine carboxypeptidase (penicillin-binding protein 5/6)